jgi:hypothetical protein
MQLALNNECIVPSHFIILFCFDEFLFLKTNYFKFKFTSFPLKKLAMSGFNPALAQAPREPAVQAPFSFPAALTNFLRRMTNFDQQFRSNIVFEASGEISPEAIALNIGVVNQCMGRVHHIVGLTADRAVGMLTSAVWIVMDTRGVPDQPTSNPVDAQVKHLPSMAIFTLKLFAIDSAKPMDGSNVTWQACLVASKLTPERDAIYIPDRNAGRDFFGIRGLWRFQTCFCRPRVPCQRSVLLQVAGRCTGL